MPPGFAGHGLLNTGLGQAELDRFIVIDDVHCPSVIRTRRIVRRQNGTIDGYGDALVGEINVLDRGHGESDGIIVPALIETDIDPPVANADTRTIGSGRPYIKSVQAARLHQKRNRDIRCERLRKPEADGGALPLVYSRRPSACELNGSGFSYPDGADMVPEYETRRQRPREFDAGGFIFGNRIRICGEGQSAFGRAAQLGEREDSRVGVIPRSLDGVVAGFGGARDGDGNRGIPGRCGGDIDGDGDGLPFGEFNFRGNASGKADGVALGNGEVVVGGNGERVSVPRRINAPAEMVAREALALFQTPACRFRPLPFDCRRER